MTIIQSSEIIDDEKTKFLLVLAHSVAGGYPAIGIRQGEDRPDYLVAPTCECKECQAYLAATAAEANTSVIEAIRRYVDTRLAWERSLEQVNATRH